MVGGSVGVDGSVSAGGSGTNKGRAAETIWFLSMSQEHYAVSKPPKPMRGGMPICFPQVANFGTLEQHGFARNRLWEVDEDPSPLPPTNNQSMVDLVLKSTEDDLHTWSYRFEFRLRVCVGANKLTMIPRVRNVDCKTFSFTIALRNYFSVSDVSFGMTRILKPFEIDSVANMTLNEFYRALVHPLDTMAAQ